MGLVLPGELAVLSGGVLAADGRVSLPAMLAVACVAAIAGGSVRTLVDSVGATGLEPVTSAV